MRSRSRGGILWTLRSSPTLRKSLLSFPLSLVARPRTSAALALPPLFCGAFSLPTADRPLRVTLEFVRTSDAVAVVVPTRLDPLRIVPALEEVAAVPLLRLVEEPVRTWDVPVVLLVEEPVRTWLLPVLLLVEEEEPVRTCGLLVEPELRTVLVPVLLLAEEEEPVRTCELLVEPELRTVLVPVLLLEEEEEPVRTCAVPLLEEELLRTDVVPVERLAEDDLLDEDELLLTCDPLEEEEREDVVELREPVLLV